MASNPFPTPKPPTPEQEQAHAEMQRSYGFCGQLLESDAFKWFLLNCLEPKIEEQAKIIDDLDTSPADTTLAKHKKQVLTGVRDFVKIKHAEARDSLKEDAKPAKP